MDPKFKTQFRRHLLRWYREHQRDLPWRRTKDPYSIWVSEIMLQQTQVATVLPYYHKFLKRFPSIKSLARAKEEEVLALWSGLGYYRRAKLLHRGAGWVVELGGNLPEEAKELQNIPGIGPYTAGAIASIAFGKTEPLVDGNVIRVLSRVFARKGHPKEGRLQKEIWNLASQLVGGNNPGDFNQGLMELGATLCRTVLPSCERCPLTTQCLAYQKGQPEKFPESAPSGKTLKLNRVVAICQKGDQTLLVKRHQPRWFQGMWELPHDYLDSVEDAKDCLSEFLKSSLGIALKTPQALNPTRHSITHHRIASYAWRGQVRGRLRPNSSYEKIKYFSSQELSRAALSNFDRKVLGF